MPVITFSADPPLIPDFTAASLVIGMTIGALICKSRPRTRADARADTRAELGQTLGQTPGRHTLVCVASSADHGVLGMQQLGA